VCAFVVVHPNGVILFDTGVGEAVAEIDEWYRPERRSLRDELAHHGVELAQVSGVANSHLHFDHCGQNALFPGIPIYVQANEYRAAQEPDYTISAWVDFPGAVYEFLDGETEVLPGVRLFPTPGHTPGHQSLIVEMEELPVVVAGQAVYTLAEWEGATDPRRSGKVSAWDPATYAESVRQLRALHPARVLFSHDLAESERA
jgi:glyoxylase-like metal-dependent hydrolase (beta-lactamase superfamily II)